MQKLKLGLVLGLVNILMVVAAAGQDRPVREREEELVGLLPESDLVAVIDLGRLITDVQPRLEKAGRKESAALTVQLNQIAARLGVDPRQLKSGVLGLTLQSFEATGVMIVDGVDLDRRAVEETLRSARLDFRIVEHQGESIISLLAPLKALSIGPLSLRTADLALATLGGRRFVVGDLALVRRVIERRSRPVSTQAPAVVAALREAGATALVRFAFTPTPGMREEAVNQGDLFKSIAAIKVLIGDLDLTPDLGADLAINLNALMRTGSDREAAELEIGLKGLLNLARALFVNGNKQLALLLNQVQIRTRGADATLVMTLPASLIK